MKNEEIVRVLQYMVSNDKGGLTKYICQNYKFINKDKIQFDFITYDRFLDFEEEFSKEGARFYRVPRLKNVFKYFKFWRTLQRKNKYKIVHFHMSYTNIVPIIFAKSVGIENIILHAHSTQIDDNRFFIRAIKTILNFLGKYLVQFLVKKYLACSDLAAKWMFPVKIIKEKKYILAHNAIDLKKYIFDKNMRKKKRKELCISDKCFCIGHVGRFTYQKNHDFLIDIFYEIYKVSSKAELLLIGENIDNKKYIDKIKNKIEKLHLNANVKFLGKRDDVPQIMQAMDCLVLTSLFEGLPLVGIEAQAAGLPCFFSDTITKEVKITNLVNFISLKKKPEFWAEKILNTNTNIKRFSLKEILSSGYDINMEIKKIEKIYLLDKEN